MKGNPQEIKIDANVVIENLLQQIADLSQENAILKANIKSLNEKENNNITQIANN